MSKPGPSASACSGTGTKFLRFLNRLERDIPAGKLVHVVLDNYGSHKHCRPKPFVWTTRPASSARLCPVN